jgi:hypothetical protein
MGVLHDEMEKLTRERERNKLDGNAILYRIDSRVK